MERYLKFREEYSRFFYRGYDVEETLNELKITYTFEIEGLSVFTPTWTFPKNGNPEAKWMEDPLMEKMIFSLGMVELVSYWKITCSPQVVIEAGSLSEEQILWWKDLYFNGLGEFFYVNKITEADPEGFMEIVCPLSEEEVCGKQLRKEAGHSRRRTGRSCSCRRRKRLRSYLRVIKRCRCTGICLHYQSKRGNHPYHRVCETDSRPCDQCTPYTG